MFHPLRFSLPIIVFLVISVASGRIHRSQKRLSGFSITKSNTISLSRERLMRGDHSFVSIRPADRAAGIEVLEFTPITGDWDWIAFFPIEADFLIWERSPMSLRARAKFEEMIGGAENAKKLDKEFFDLIQELKIEIMARDLAK
jgi:hypothetical protein